jgi:hypothetical protein
MFEVTFKCGIHIDNAVTQLIEGAAARQQPHYGRFNGTFLIARPGESFETVRAAYHDSLLADDGEKDKFIAADRAAQRYTKLRELNCSVSTEPPPGMRLDPKGEWDVAYVLNCLTPEQLAALPVGTRLYSLTGEEMIVGVDTFDTDTRFGFTAYGFKQENF